MTDKESMKPSDDLIRGGQGRDVERMLAEAVIVGIAIGLAVALCVGVWVCG